MGGREHLGHYFFQCISVGTGVERTYGQYESSLSVGHGGELFIFYGFEERLVVFGAVRWIWFGGRAHFCVFSRFSMCSGAFQIKFVLVLSYKVWIIRVPNLENLC